MAEPKKDWVPVAAVGVGAAAIGLGVYFWTRKPPGVSPGEVVRAHFKFDYLGEGGNYVLLVRFGYYQPPYMPFGFDEEEKMGHHTLEITLPEPLTYEFNLDCVIPDGAPARTYDAEGSILTPEMEPGKDWIIRVFKKGAVTVREE